MPFIILHHKSICGSLSDNLCYPLRIYLAEEAIVPPTVILHGACNKNLGQEGLHGIHLFHFVTETYWTTPFQKLSSRSRMRCEVGAGSAWVPSSPAWRKVDQRDC